MSSQKLRQGRFYRLIFFSYVWLTVGFFSGTLVLVGPVRWLTTFTRAKGWEQQTENWLMLAVMAALACGSALISWKLTCAAGTAPIRNMTLPIVTTLLAMGALWVWMNPAWINPPSDFQVASLDPEERFVFGPYPGRDRLMELKAAGFQGVISLLHPAVVPFEPRLLSREESLAEELGIELIHAPMLPWISDNQESLDLISSVVEEGSGRYYVHCYLGKDRVNLVRRLISSQGVQIAESESGSRILKGLARLERGPIHELEDEVYLIPYPTPEEWTSFIIGGGVESVLSLLDNEEDRQWLEREKEALASFDVGLTHVPVASSGGRRAIAEAVQIARKLPRPLVIHDFLSEFSRSFVSRTFFACYQGQLPECAQPSESDSPILVSRNEQTEKGNND